MGAEEKFGDCDPKLLIRPPLPAREYRLYHVSCDMQYIRHTSETKFKDISDGLSKTLFIGEKQLHEDGLTLGYKFDDGSVYNSDSLQRGGRFAGPGHPLGRGPRDPDKCPRGQPCHYYNFGSWHPGICQFVMGDGSVRALNNTIDTMVLSHLANRMDGNVLSAELLQ